MKFPELEAVTHESATRNQIQTGVLTRFYQEVAWQFYLHLEPKYPDKYRGT